MSKQVKVTSIIRKLYVEANGQLVEVKQVDNVDEYGKDVTIYTKEAAKGANKGATLYAVAVADFMPKKRVAKTSKASIQSMLDSGMTAEQVVALLTK